MFFLIVIIALILYHQHSPTPPIRELWFMLSVFVALAYVAGFLDSRLYRRLDRKNKNLLADIEARYAQSVEPHSPQ
jgi:TRAP-type C4-dicarboxylate transport system permease small subunit